MTTLGSQIRLGASPQVLHSQTKIAPQSMKTKISTALVNILTAIPQVKYVSFDDIKILVQDFNDTEIPAIQIIDLASTITHEQSRVRYLWRLAVEIVLKSRENNTVNQQDLWNLEYEVIRAIFAVPNFYVPGVLHAKLTGSVTDLHLLKPYYFSRLDLEIDFYENAVRLC